jgi:hypothetical protein
VILTSVRRNRSRGPQHRAVAGSQPSVNKSMSFYVMWAVTLTSFENQA